MRCLLCDEWDAIHDLRVCAPCGWIIAQRFASRILADERRKAAESAQAGNERRAARRYRDGHVYYVDLGEHVKIGFTTQLRTRMHGLRVDPDRLLAAEPGPLSLEGERHAEFAVERLGRRREDFHKSERLMAHIEAVLARHPLPQWATLPSTNRVAVRRVR